MEVHRIELPLTTPLLTGRGPIVRRRGMVGVRRERGVEAIAEMTPHPDAAADDVEAIVVAAQTASPDEPQAAAFAAWLDLDESARIAGIPVAALLSANPVDNVPVNALIGAAAGAADARRAVTGGFQTLKVKLAGDLDQSVVRLKEIRAALGNDIAIRVDANGVWSRMDAAEAIEALTALDLEYIEDPLAPGEDWSWLQESPVPLAVDAVDPHSDVLEVVDVMVLKPSVMHPDRALLAAERAFDHGSDVVVTSVIEGAIGIGAALNTAAALGVRRACGLATSALLATDVADPPPIRNGSMALSRPGVGVVLDEDRLTQVAVTAFTKASNG